MPKPSAPVPPRRGARRRADIPPDVLARINRGLEPTITLVEILAADFNALLAAADPASARRATIDPALGVIGRMRAAASILLESRGPAAAARFADHPSDIVRGWACFMIGLDPSRRGLRARLTDMRPLADDPHSGVREWAWLALRPLVGEHPANAVTILAPWTRLPSANLRRFASEITRPRGVWCAHIESLKIDPSPGLPLLEPLRADTHKYVQDSVGNWINDAAKSNPDWARDLAARWRRESPTPHTERILRRGLRSAR